VCAPDDPGASAAVLGNVMFLFGADARAVTDQLIQIDVTRASSCDRDGGTDRPAPAAKRKEEDPGCRPAKTRSLLLRALTVNSRTGAR
jgi:hypothetical protein